MVVVTYSRSIFIAVANLCRNRCGYCSFRRDATGASVISRREALSLLDRGATAGCHEALFSAGEAPHEVSGSRDIFPGSGDLLDYVVDLSEEAIDRGLLPHTNLGLIDPPDLRRLAPYNASMGLMIETTAQVSAHHGSPGKDPRLRLAFIEEAGRHGIPFTTGILIGIGETAEDRLRSLQAIADLHRRHDHIQEVIIQPFDPHPGTPMESWPRPDVEDVVGAVRLARKVLPPEVAVQVPPNLTDPLPLIRAGASDLGGISTVTPDWINPGRPWPVLAELSRRLQGYTLKERLPIYPRYVLAGRCGWRVAGLLKVLAGEDGLARGGTIE